MASFEEELRALGKRRIRLQELRVALLRARPETVDAPNLRQLLLDALRELQSRSALDLPGQGWDTSGMPALPRTVRLLDMPELQRNRTALAWLPALAFAAEERHPVRRADLEAINAFLLSARGREVVAVPTRERSLQIFGDEKRLDKIRKGKPDLYDGRVSLDDLRCYPVAPPLPWEQPRSVADGKPVLVLENYHSYESFRRWNREAACYAAIAYGGGNAFRQGAGNLDEVIVATGAIGTLYLGDLDPAGVEILLGVNQRRRADRRMPVQPHCGLYEWLLAHGCRRPLEKSPGESVGARLGEVFPGRIVDALAGLWAAGHRIPQESYGLEQLHGPEASIADPDAAGTRSMVHARVCLTGGRPQ